MSDREMDGFFAKSIDTATTVKISDEEAERRAKIVAMAWQCAAPVLPNQPILDMQKIAERLSYYMHGNNSIDNSCLMVKPGEVPNEPERAVANEEIVEKALVCDVLKPKVKRKGRTPGELKRYGMEQQPISGCPEHHYYLSPSSSMRSLHEVRKPIIVVPSDLNSLVTMHNIKLILEDLNFTYPYLQRRWHEILPDEMSIMRTYRKQQEYCVINDVTNLSAQDWQRVVAVFVYNPNEQFNKWPFNGDHTEICRQLCAFQLVMEGDSILWTLDSLYVNIIVLPREDKERERKILKMLWRRLDRHMNKTAQQVDSDDDD